MRVNFHVVIGMVLLAVVIFALFAVNNYCLELSQSCYNAIDFLLM